MFCTGRVVARMNPVLIKLAVDSVLSAPHVWDPL